MVFVKDLLVAVVSAAISNVISDGILEVARVVFTPEKERREYEEEK